jgi:hypothetical protein
VRDVRPRVGVGLASFLGQILGLNNENLLQRSRFELKYLITEHRAAQVRAFARQYLAADPNAGRTPEGYPVYTLYSVYLDSPKLDLLQATVDAHKNRFKLRVRYYDENPKNPVYFEIKRRVNGAILKERAKVRRECAHRLLTGGVPNRDDLQNPHASDQYASLRRFLELAEKLKATPRVIVGYDREAWLTPDGNSARLTFDRNVIGGPYNHAFTVQHGPDWVMPDVGGVVLELKFTDRFPNWMRNMVQLFGLERCSMAKYVKCAHTLSRRQTSTMAMAASAAASLISPLKSPTPDAAPARVQTPGPAQAPALTPTTVSQRQGIVLPPGFSPVPRWA